MRTRVTRLVIQNLGIIEDIDVSIDKPLFFFFGDVRQGKSTILYAVQFLSGGGLRDGILRDGQMEGLVRLETTRGSIERTLLRGRDGKVRARPITYVIDGVAQKGNVVKAVAELFSPFQLNQRFFTDMTAVGKLAFLLDLLDVDTTEIDAGILRAEKRAVALRAEVKAYGDIVPVQVELVDVEALRAERERVIAAAQAAGRAVADANAEIEKHNYTRAQVFAAADDLPNSIASIQTQIDTLRGHLAEAETALKDKAAWLATPANAEQAKTSGPPPADTSAIDEQISDAKAVAVRHEQYLGKLARLEEKEQKQASLKLEERAARDARKTRLASLSEASETCPIKGLSIGQDGEVLYDGTTMSMLSDSQGIELSSRIQGMYPDGLGIELIDRGESLGICAPGYRHPISELVERAKAEFRTILITGVGETDARTTDTVGVFRVTRGELAEMIAAADLCHDHALADDLTEAAERLGPEPDDPPEFDPFM